MDLKQDSEQKHPRQCPAALSQSKAAILVFRMHPSRFPFTCHPHQAAASRQCHCLLFNVPQQPQLPLLPWQEQAVGLGHIRLYLGPQVQTQPQASRCWLLLNLELKQKNKSAERSALQIHRQGLQTASKNEKKNERGWEDGQMSLAREKSSWSWASGFHSY